MDLNIIAARMAQEVDSDHVQIDLGGVAPHILQKVYDHEGGGLTGRVTRIEFPTILRFSASIFSSAPGLRLIAVKSFDHRTEAQEWLHRHIDQPSFLYLRWNGGQVLYDV